MMRKILSMILAVFFLAACGGSSGSGDNGNGENGTNLPSCTSYTLFAALPMATSDIRGLVPLGNLNPPGHTFPTDHIYFYMQNSDPDDPDSTTTSVKVYSPSDATITQITASYHQTADPPYTDYNIYFYPCAEVQAYFFHMTSLSDTILNEAGSIDEDCTTHTTGDQTYETCSKDTEIEISASEEIGAAGGVTATDALDFGAYDSRITQLSFITPSRYEGDNDLDKLHTICPVDYFTDDLKTTLEAEFSSYNGESTRTAEPLCGEIEQDEPGTAQGNWFNDDDPSTITEDPHLALVHDNIDPTIAVFANGVSISGLPTDTYYFEPAMSGNVNLDFDLVTADGNIYCYDNLFNTVGIPHTDKIIVLQLTDASTLRIEKQAAVSCESGPWSFGSSYRDFNR